MKDLSNLQQKVEEFRVRNSSGMWPEIVSARTSIVSCLSKNQHQTLNCGEEVESFKQLVHKLESEYVGSLRP
ncbi:uncharacterized protein MELLADRAFT_73621 [Melampsora larici-populina 98AG31]|uniref:Uncharacterized protein n=1 Tax=Melampsora larici-populina (strain 98AG31 / pathotype 3-4-7) TaxID=747676 RepID=F4SAJ0_MELLP|nr:uncharacterized protein MELLADRAFT_73621 [Melampsora larici-populina 98AG31]EGF98347.1 hypothetical protein MELLADRAFT_73621 [Melampsora larici-populina 98AG31]